MSKPILILGKSGSGKSSSLTNLNPKETFLINTIGKELPFRGALSKYVPLNKEAGNMLISDDYDKINQCFSYIDNKRPETKLIVIDDSQYLIVNEFMRKHSTQGKGNQVFQLYNEIGDHFWNLIWNARLLRQDLTVAFLHHSENDEFGGIKSKTIGKMLDEKVDIPGMFTICLHCISTPDGNFFETQNTGNTPAKSPAGMFESLRIPNDLQLVINAIKTYERG